MNRQVRTRFAPSPTGYLHIGGARTALFCWLYARHHDGTFILRIEDTDLERSTPESIQTIMDSMAWLQLDYDEGPFYQTKRFDRYQEVIQQLLSEGHAYRCYCTHERLDALREQQMQNKEKPRYDGYCRDSDEEKDAPFVIRFRNPLEGNVVFEDQVMGTISVSNTELDDLIIARSDGTPTYNFTVVVDDWDMQISHVIRGSDHLNNTPRQINIFKALGAEVPVYAHVPMILGGDGKKLSKRHGAVSVMEYDDCGYLPDALLNYLVRLGWSHGDQEIFSREEMIRFFDLDHVNKAPAAFNEEKCLWLNQHYLKSDDPQTILPAFVKQLESLGVDVAEGPDPLRIIPIQAERCKSLVEMAEKSLYFYKDFDVYDEKAAKKNLQETIREPLMQVKEKMSALPEWSAEPLHQVIIDLAESLDLKLGKLAQPIRVAITGGSVSPPLDITLELIGRDRVLARLDQALSVIR